MKKIALFLIIVAIGVMSSGDILAQHRGGGGNRGGEGRGGGSRGGEGRPGGGGPRISGPGSGSMQMRQGPSPMQSRPSRDTFQSRPGRDTLQSGPSRDTFQSGPSRDTFQSRPGRDTLQSGPSRDTFQSRPFSSRPPMGSVDSNRSTRLGPSREGSRGGRDFSRPPGPDSRSNLDFRTRDGVLPGTAGPRRQIEPGRRPGGDRISPERRDSIQDWIGRGGGKGRPDIRSDYRSGSGSRYWPGYRLGYGPGYGPGSRYSHYGPYHPPYHHRHPYYPGWRPGWWNLPVAWGMGSAWWYWNTPDTYVYYNPYAVYVRDPVYDYAQPVYLYTTESVADDSDATTSTEGGTTTEEAENATDQAAMQDFQEARDAFKAENYADAMQKINDAIKKSPKDAAMHEFLGLVFFAEGKFNPAAGVINSVLASGPGWDWNTMINLYQNPEQYTKQLRKLEDFVRENKDDAAAKFLLAYHYLVMGYTENAETQLKDVVQLQPKDVLSKRLLDMIETSKKADESAPKTPPTPTE